MSIVEKITDPAELRRQYQRTLEDLVRAARADGIVLRIENVPMRPLSMGSYTQVVHADYDNAVYRKESK